MMVVTKQILYQLHNESVSLVNATENLDSAIATLLELVDSLTERLKL